MKVRKFQRTLQEARILSRRKEEISKIKTV